MKGLIIKDLMCLRKQRITFIFTVICTVILGSMFVLSVRYGNIHTMNQSDPDLTELDVKTLGTMALTMFMLLPLAMAGDVATVFSYDSKAGFSKVGSSLPVSMPKRVMAKYATMFIMVGIGIVLDVVIAGVLSTLTDIIRFRDFFGIIMSMTAVMVVHASLTILYAVCFGDGQENAAMLVAIMTMGIGVMVVMFPKLKKLVQDMIEMGVSNGTDTPVSGSGLGGITQVMDFLKNRYYILLLIAAAVAVASYFGTVAIVKRKRGTI